MIDEHDAALRAHLMREEGVRNMPYRDHLGILTIGVGRNLQANGLSDDEVQYLLRNDIRESLHEATTYPWFAMLDDERQRVVTEMIFQLGAYGYSRFKRMHAALADGDYDEAAAQVENSRMATQVPQRVARIARRLRQGDQSTTEVST